MAGCALIGACALIRTNTVFVISPFEIVNFEQLAPGNLTVGNVVLVTYLKYLEVIRCSLG